MATKQTRKPTRLQRFGKRQRIIRWTSWFVASIMFLSIVAGYFLVFWQ